MDALLVVDIQNDSLPGGALAVGALNGLKRREQDEFLSGSRYQLQIQSLRDDHHLDLLIVLVLVIVLDRFPSLFTGLDQGSRTRTITSTIEEVSK